MVGVWWKISAAAGIDNWCVGILGALQGGVPCLPIPVILVSGTPLLTK